MLVGKERRKLGRKASGGGFRSRQRYWRPVTIQPGSNLHHQLSANPRQAIESSTGVAFIQITNKVVALISLVTSSPILARLPEFGSTPNLLELSAY
jgi:hypothetical protein